MSSFYYLRNHPNIDKLKEGESIAIDMFFDDETTKFKLKYVGKERIIKGTKRISTPGRRVYSSVEDMPRVLSGLGIAIVSTSRGIDVQELHY